MATAYTDQVQKVYIAYYGRAADPVGLAYWAGKVETDGLAGIMANFGASAEATTLYGSLTSDTAKVNALYQQTFGRDADFAGLMYYAGQLSAGTMTAASIAQNIFDGAAGADATILANKLIVAKAYTAAIDTASEVVAYSGTVAAASARALLTTVDAATVTATFDVATSVASVVTVSNTAAAVTGSTYVLTTGIDTLVGTANADVFSAIQSATATTETWDVADTIDGGAGADILNLTSEEAASANATTVTNVETVNYRAALAGGDIDMQNMTGVTTLNLDRWTGATDVSNLGLSTALTITSGTGTLNSTVAFLASDVTGAADASTVTVSGVLDGAELDFTGAVETITINTTGSAARFDNLVLASTTTALAIGADEAFRIDDIFTATGITSLTVTGDSSVIITPTLADSVATIQASTNTGGVNVLIGNVAATVTGGSGNDRFAFAATELASTDTVVGGAGTDTISIMDETISTALATEINASTGIEILEMGATGSTIDMELAANSFTGMEKFIVSGAAPVGTVGGAALGSTAATVGIASMTLTTNVADTIQFKGAAITGGIGGAAEVGDIGAGGATSAAGLAGANGGAALTATNSIDGGSNTLSVEMTGGVTMTGGAGGAGANGGAGQTSQTAGIGGAGGAAGDGGAAISAATIETLNISSTGTTANTIAGGAGGAVGIAGATGANTGGAGGAAGAVGSAGAGIIVNTNGTINVTGTQNIDIGTISGTNATVNASTFTGKLTVIGEAGNNTITGGSKADTISTGDGQDTITGGAGTDIFIFNTDLDAELGTTTGLDANSIADYASDTLRIHDTVGNDVYGVAGLATLGAATTTIGIDGNGLATFHVDDNTLTEKIAALVSDADVANNELVIFNHASDTFVYGASNTAAAGDDFLIKLTGVTLTSINEGNTSGDFTVS